MNSRRLSLLRFSLLARLITGLEALVLTPILSWYEFSALIISRFVAETSLELIDAF
jgi:hypothetical protein